MNRVSLLSVLLISALFARSTVNADINYFDFFTQISYPIQDGELSQGFDLSISQEQLNIARNQVDRDLLNTSLFIIPKNDGEALRAIEILNAVDAPYVHISTQAWGATLDKESLPLDTLKKVTRVVIFEMPGVEIENSLLAKGFEVIIIDHHAYKDLDRRKDESSLEQLAQLINWPMNRADMAIAVNDRSYIPGLKKMGLSEQDIRDVRQFDLVAQGNSIHKIEQQTIEAKRIIPTLPTRGNVFILKNITLNEAIMNQELAIQSKTGVVSVLKIRQDKIGFSGDPRVVKRLLALNFEDLGYESQSFAQYGGGDPKATMFFGFKPTRAPKGDSELIPERVQEAIIKEIDLAINDTTSTPVDITN